MKINSHIEKLTESLEKWRMPPLGIYTELASVVISGIRCEISVPVEASLRTLHKGELPKYVLTLRELDGCPRWCFKVPHELQARILIIKLTNLAMASNG